MTQADLLMAEIERGLDGDLDRGERLALFEHLAAAPEAAAMMAEAVALQRRMESLAAADDRIEPSAAFMAAPLAAPRPDRRFSSLVRTLGAWVRHPVATHGWGGLAGGAVAAAIFAFVIAPTRDLRLIEQMAAKDVRLHALEVPFHAVADAHEWTHDIDLAPGETARLEILQGHEGDYHLRVSGGDDLDISLVHSRANAADEARRHRGGKVHYTSLKAPKAGDELVLTNHGTATLKVSVSAKHKDAVTLRPHRAAKPEQHAGIGHERQRRK